MQLQSNDEAALYQESDRVRMFRPRDKKAERRALNAVTRRLADEFHECADLLGDDFLNAMRGAV